MGGNIRVSVKGTLRSLLPMGITSGQGCQLPREQARDTFLVYFLLGGAIQVLADPFRPLETHFCGLVGRSPAGDPPNSRLVTAALPKEYYRH